MSDENNVVGEEFLSTTNMEVKEIPLVKPGKYGMTFKASSVRVGKEWNSVPNISLQHKLGEEGNNRVVFSKLLMSVQPDKNGQAHFSKKNGLKAFLNVLGTDIEKLPLLKKTVTNPDTQESVELKWIDPSVVQEVLKTYYGHQYEGRVTISKGTPPFADSNDVFEFFKID